MKIYILIVGFLLGASVVRAAIVEDNFNRPDQGSSSDGSLIGSNWVNADNINRWAINGSSLRAVVVDQPAVLYNDALTTGTIADRSFSLSVDVAGKVMNAWSGIIFNYQNPSNFYTLRFKEGSTSYQLNRVVNGGTGGPVFADDATTPFTLGSFYTLTVTSTNAYEFDFAITEVGSSTVLNPITNAVDGNSNFIDGYAGVYNGSPAGWAGVYDNFHLESEPLPVPGPLVTDDFNRANTTYGTEGASVGTYWMNSDGTDDWKISESNLFLNAQTDPAILYNVESPTISGNGTNFVLSVDVAANVADGWAGIVFNYQNPSNYYMLRFKEGSTSYQLNRVVNGGTGGPVFANDAAASFTLGSFYTLTVTSTNAYEFDFTITAAGSSVVLNPTATAVDGNNNFTGGYAGVYSPTTSGSTDPDAMFNNFSLESITDSGPLPATIVSVSTVSGGLVRIVIDAPNAAFRYAIKTSSDLPSGIWVDGSHSDDGVNNFVVTNLAYSTKDGDHEVIYVQANDANAFFGIGESL